VRFAEARATACTIVLALLRENHAIEVMITRVVRVSQLIGLIETRFRLRKSLEVDRVQEIQQEWMKVVTDKVQEKLKSNQKLTKNQVQMKRWLSFQEAARSSQYLGEKGQDLYAFQKLAYQLEDNVVLINETNKRYLDATEYSFTELADKYLQRLISYQERLQKRLADCDKIKAKLGLKMKAEKSSAPPGTDKKKKMAQPGRSDFAALKKKLVQVGVAEELISENLEVGSMCGEACEIGLVGAAAEQVTFRVDELVGDKYRARLEYECQFPKGHHVGFRWMPIHKTMLDSVESSFNEYDKKNFQPVQQELKERKQAKKSPGEAHAGVPDDQQPTTTGAEQHEHGPDAGQAGDVDGE